MADEDLIKRVIVAYMDEINANDFKELYIELLDRSVNPYDDIPYLTKVLTDAGLDVMSSLTTIPMAFMHFNDDITQLVIPDNVKSINEMAFASCANLSKVVVLNGCKKFYNNVFDHCTNLRSVYLPGSLSFIGHRAFRKCESLTHLEIPHIEYLGEQVFADCTSLKDLAFDCTFDELKDLQRAADFARDLKQYTKVKNIQCYREAYNKSFIKVDELLNI